MKVISRSASFRFYCSEFSRSGFVECSLPLIAFSPTGLFPSSASHRFDVFPFFFGDLQGPHRGLFLMFIMWGGYYVPVSGLSSPTNSHGEVGASLPLAQTVISLFIHHAARHNCPFALLTDDRWFFTCLFHSRCGLPQG